MSKEQSSKKSQNNFQGAGSEYHREHAENVQGYGSNDVGSNEASNSNMTDKRNQ